MSIVVEIGHPDADIGAQGARVTQAIEDAGFGILKPFAPHTGLVTLDVAPGDADDAAQRLEDALGEAFPAFVEMNRFYVKVMR